MVKRIDTLALIEAILAIIIWGLSFIFMKVVLRELSAVTLIVLRYTLGTLFLCPFAWWRGDFSRCSVSDVPALAGAGALGITVQQLLQVTGQVSADASVAAFLAATAPAFTVLLAAGWLHERLHPRQVIGVILASSGGIAVAIGDDWLALFRGQAGETLFGNALILLSAIVWAIFIILSKHLVQHRPAALVTSGMFFFGLIFTLPIFLAQEGWLEIPRLSPGGWGATLFIGILSTAVAYLMNSHALKYISAARVAVIQNLEPLVAVGGAALLLNESMTWTMLFGGTAILCGVYLAERYAPRLAQR